MSQDQVILLLFRIVLLTNIAAILAFVGIYTAFAPWWRDVIGRNIVTLDILLGLAFVPTTLSLFWHLNRLTSYVMAWIDVGIFTLIAGSMIWRCVTWIRIHRKGNPGDKQEELSWFACSQLSALRFHLSFTPGACITGRSTRCCC